jgi:hypothetical protein
MNFIKKYYVNNHTKRKEKKRREKKRKEKKRKCIKRESNPQLNLGRVTCYHYTIDALCPTCRIRTSDLLDYSQTLFH